MLVLVFVHGAGFAISFRRYLSAGSKWDRFVREPAAVGWLTAFVAIVATLVGFRWIRRGALCFVAAVAVGAFAVGGGTALGGARNCDTKDGRALLREVVGFTSVVEPLAVHVCAGQGRVRRPRWSSELSPRSVGERRKIVEFLDEHGLVDLDSSTMFTAVFDVYTIEVEMPSPDRSGEIVVARVRP